MKRFSVDIPVDFHWIRNVVVEPVLQIAYDCQAIVPLDYAAGSRARQWAICSSIWDLRTMNEYLETKDRISTVMAVARKVVGYLFYTAKQKAVVIDQVAVGPEYWRNGFATQNLHELKSEMREMRPTVIGLRVSEYNLGAQLLFRENGFKWLHTSTEIRSLKQWYMMRRKQSVN